MSFINFENATDTDVICQYIMQCRGKGHFLPYTDYEIVVSWLRQSRNADTLLLVLSEHLPAYYEKKIEKTHPPSLKGIDRKIRSKLKEMAARV